MDIRQPTHPDDLAAPGTAALRRRFLVEDLFGAGEVRLAYSQHDRLVIGRHRVMRINLDADYVHGHVLAVDGGWLAR
jgi:5-keto 4-deoxyuronate isomerase